MLRIHEWSVMLGKSLSVMNQRDSCVNVQDSMTARENSSAMAWTCAWKWPVQGAAGHSE